MEGILHHHEEFNGFIGEKPYHGPAESFHCPGCKYGHWFGTGHGGWVMTGTREKPTVMPSILVNKDNDPSYPRCHLFIKDGMIKFLGDCTHELRGKTVPMESY
jgi:hypothetical protein